MSAYIISEKHIDVLVWTATHYAESDLFSYYYNNEIKRGILQPQDKPI